ncbi:MAG: Dabb family protein, partial [Christensenellaceae bacterium]|nr:Dabb family protein [Christensenellaceae bacterium]
MIRHIVMWKLKDEALGKTKKENIAIIKEKLYALKPIIPEILSMEVHENVNDADAVA